MKSNLKKFISYFLPQSQSPPLIRILFQRFWIQFFKNEFYFLTISFWFVETRTREEDIEENDLFYTFSKIDFELEKILLFESRLLNSFI